MEVEFNARRPQCLVLSRKSLKDSKLLRSIDSLIEFSFFFLFFRFIIFPCYNVRSVKRSISLALCRRSNLNDSVGTARG